MIKDCHTSKKYSLKKNIYVYAVTSFILNVLIIILNQILLQVPQYYQKADDCEVSALSHYTYHQSHHLVSRQQVNLHPKKSRQVLNLNSVRESLLLWKKLTGDVDEIEETEVCLTK